MGIRTAAKAIIIEGSEVLLSKNQNSMGEACYGLPNGAIYYDLHGGGQNQYETIEDALIRECLEETGYLLTAPRLAAVYEEISLNPVVREQYERHAHKIHFIFICSLSKEPRRAVSEMDFDMIGSEWIDIKAVGDLILVPPIVQSQFHTIINAKTPVFLGSDRIN